MLSIRMVYAGAVAAVAVMAALSGAAAQTATNDQPGKPLALLAGLRPPHESKTIAHAKTVRKTLKKLAAKKPRPKAAAKLASRKPGIAAQAAADQAAEDPPAQTAPAASAADVWPAVDAPPPADIATAAPPQTAPPAEAPTPSEIVVGGRTVQIVSPDQVNAIDLAAADGHDAPAAMPRDGADVPPPSQSVLAPPVREDTSGSRLTFESLRGFPADSMHASLAHANRNFHHSQACGSPPPEGARARSQHPAQARLAG